MPILILKNPEMDEKEIQEVFKKESITLQFESSDAKPDALKPFFDAFIEKALKVRGLPASYDSTSSSLTFKISPDAGSVSSKVDSILGYIEKFMSGKGKDFNFNGAIQNKEKFVKSIDTVGEKMIEDAERIQQAEYERARPEREAKERQEREKIAAEEAAIMALLTRATQGNTVATKSTPNAKENTTPENEQPVQRTQYQKRKK